MSAAVLPFARPAAALAIRPQLVLTYSIGEPQRCPFCTGRHWLVGRALAECAFCGFALPLEHPQGKEV